jgi:hypothetical protein
VVVFRYLAHAKRNLAVTPGTGLNSAGGVMESSCSDSTVWAVPDEKIEIHFIAKRNLPFHSFQARKRPIFVLVAKLTAGHDLDLLPVVRSVECFFQLSSTVNLAEKLKIRQTCLR